MKKYLLILFVTIANVTRSDDEKPPRYFAQAEIDVAVQKLSGLAYPMTQNEVMEQLGVAERHLPGIVASFGKLHAPGPMYYLIHMTDPESPKRSYELYLWFDQNPKKLSGEAFANARNIEYAEIMMSEGQVRYLAQSSRFPYIRLSFEGRAIRQN